MVLSWHQYVSGREVRHAARACRAQGPRSHPRRVTMKVTPTAFCLSSWLVLIPVRADKSAPMEGWVQQRRLLYF